MAGAVSTTKAVQPNNMTSLSGHKWSQLSQCYNKYNELKCDTFYSAHYYSQVIFGHSTEISSGLLLCDELPGDLTRKSP